MPNFTNLLTQSPVDHSDRAETLEETCRRHAKDWTEDDLLRMIEGFRTLRKKWEVTQVEGSRKRVSSKKVVVRKKKLAKPSGLKIKKVIV